VAEVTTSLTKTAARSPNRIDVIIVCRKAGKLRKRSQETPEGARANVIDALVEMRRCGLVLGDGDALSAARAAVLATGTRDLNCDWDELRKVADSEAKIAVAELSLSVS
jgi:hypothetical protein